MLRIIPQKELHFQDCECSSFLAGDTLRSSTRYHALDETALFGCGCRHEFPLRFFSLKHGERYTILAIFKIANVSCA